MEYVHIVTTSSVMVMNIKNGEQITINSDDSRFETALELVKQGDLAAVLQLDIKHVINSFGVDTDQSGVSIKVENGVGSVVVHGSEYPLENALVDRIIKMNEQGVSAKPLGNFVANLYSNPSSTAVKELYGFIEACSLPITADGCFIAYKIVKSDYMDIYSGKMNNSVGVTLSMPRHQVDDNRNNTCSAGLHFCSKEYLNHYGSSSRYNDRCVLVKINPADVVSIPSDYNNAKGRTWKYEVVGEMAAGWRDTLPKADYTSHAVVDEDGSEFIESSFYELGYELGQDDAWDGDYNFDYHVEYEDLLEGSLAFAEFEAGYNAGYNDGM